MGVRRTERSKDEFDVVIGIPTTLEVDTLKHKRGTFSCLPAFVVRIEISREGRYSMVLRSRY